MQRRNAYNLPDVINGISISVRAECGGFAGVALTELFCAFSRGGSAWRKLSRGDARTAIARLGARRRDGVLLVLPFDNRTGQPSLEWIREAAAEILSMRFASAGFQPTSRADRMYALDHLGLPQGFQPSRASSLKLAQTLDADSIVVGSYTTDGSGIVAEARLVDVPRFAHDAEVSGARRDARPDRRVRHAGVEADASSWIPRSTWPRRRLSRPGSGVPLTRSSSTFAASRSRTRRSGCGTCSRR